MRTRVFAFLACLAVSTAGCNSLLGNATHDLVEDAGTAAGDDATTDGAATQEDSSDGPNSTDVGDAAAERADATVDATTEAGGDGGSSTDGDAGSEGGDAGVARDSGGGDGNGGGVDASGNDGGCVSLSDIHTCGSCGNDCTKLPNVSQTGLACNAGHCSFSCASGYADCADSGVACDTMITTTSNCGACGAGCSGSAPLCAAEDAGVYGCASGCAAGETNCSGTCANLSTDNGHCGNCTTACATGQTCVSSVCTCPTANPDLCGSVCTNKQTDNANCGTCSHQCTPTVASTTASCSGGNCVITCNTTGLSLCGSSCVDEQTDNNNCGACTHACTSAETCMSGVCQPVCNLSACPNGCCSGTTCELFSVQSAGLCGALGAACGTCAATGEQCASTAGGGACGCPSGTMLCGSACTNLQTDGANCGRCNHSCLGGMCMGGVCQAITFESGMGSLIGDLASDGTVVVWADLGNNTIDQVSSPGGPTVVLGDGTQGVNGPSSIAISASGNVSWLQYISSSTSTQQGLAQRGNPNSTSIRMPTLGPGLLPHGLVEDPNNASSLYGLIQGNSNITVSTCPVTGGCTAWESVASAIPGGTSTKITGQGSVGYVADDGTYAYFSPANGVNNPIVRVPLTGSTTTQTVVPNTAGPVGAIATDGVNVYFESNHGLFYVGASGGPSPISLTSIAVSGSDLKYVSGALYFTEGSTDIYKLATP